MVKHVIPTSLKEALDYLKDSSYKIMAGGTDLMIQRRAPAGLPPRFEQNVLYLFNLAELRYIKQENGYIHIGAMTPLEDVYQHALTPDLLKQVIFEMASPGIRHMATMAGNIGNASPAGDSLVALYVLNASVKLMSVNETIIVPIKDVITGVRKTIIRPDQLIAEIIIPSETFTKVYWRKVGGRQADAISKVSIAATINMQGESIKDIRIAMGAISPTVIRSFEIEREMHGISASELKYKLPDILEKYQQIIAPIDDQRSSAAYRRRVAINLLKHLIEKEI